MSIDKDKNAQVLVTFPKEMIDLIERYWHKEQLKSRSEAIRELVKKGLESK